MNLNTKLMFLAILLSFVFGLSGYTQEEKGYQVSAEISGLKDGTVISLKSLEGKESTAIAKDGKFSFKGKVEVAGTPYTLSIAGQEHTMELLLDNSLDLYLTVRLDSLPKCNFSASKTGGNYFDFQRLVQAPFSAAYQQYKEFMKAMTSKDNYAEWEKAIKESKGTDSLRMALAREVYNHASTTYAKEVYLWIGLYPDSYYSPQLIMNWWPQADRQNAYKRLSQKVKDSYYGKVLFDQLKTHQ